MAEEAKNAGSIFLATCRDVRSKVFHPGRVVRCDVLPVPLSPRDRQHIVRDGSVPPTPLSRLCSDHGQRIDCRRAGSAIDDGTVGNRLRRRCESTTSASGMLCRRCSPQLLQISPGHDLYALHACIPSRAAMQGRQGAPPGPARPFAHALKGGLRDVGLGTHLTDGEWAHDGAQLADRLNELLP